VAIERRALRLVLLLMALFLAMGTYLPFIILTTWAGLHREHVDDPDG
jgi:hypothetical protein